eukprot:TRINITY_DN67355_c2_g4_i1.p2 TRINITY_DN67355_c2_g4~~TRINITY_DN67355_c2_g4_i1.p2  ORF type:complete len:175 (+),score=8.70 TRINITY_DN67355_c2_g4_i1:1284-1808(+)
MVLNDRSYIFQDMQKSNDRSPQLLPVDALEDSYVLASSQLWDVLCGSERQFHLVNAATSKFLDNLNGQMNVWGDGINTGHFPENITWKLDKNMQLVNLKANEILVPTGTNKLQFTKWQSATSQWKVGPTKGNLVHVQEGKFLDCDGSLWGNGVDTGLFPRNLQWYIKLIPSPQS